MSSLTTSPDFSKLKDWEELRRWVTTFCEDVKVQINGNIDFTSNLRCKIIEVDFDVANADFTIVHKLNKIPTGYILVKSSAAAVIYDGTRSATNEVIYLRSSAVALCKVLVF